MTERKDPSISLEDKAGVVKEVASGPGLEEQIDFSSAETEKAFRQVERQGQKHILARVTLTGVATHGVHAGRLATCHQQVELQNQPEAKC